MHDSNVRHYLLEVARCSGLQSRHYGHLRAKQVPTPGLTLKICLEPDRQSTIVSDYSVSP